MSNTRTIAKNTGWYSVENIVNALVSVLTSIAIARTLGPSKTGYIIYISYVATIIANLGGLGIPSVTRKYMAEYLGRGDRGTARLIFFRTFALQAGLATFATMAIVLWVLRDANAQFRWAAILIALSTWPSMVNSVPAQANGATEDLATNVPASIASAIFYLVAIVASVVLHWGVTGIGAALFLMRGVDFTVRFFPTIKRILAWGTTQALPAGLRSRMIAYSWQSVATLLLALVVWERCEVVLLKSLCTDIRQVAFYSIAFSMGNYLLLSATIFGAAAGTTIFVQFGRDRSRLHELAAASFRYLALTSIPLHFISVALAVPALLFFYGTPYKGAALVVTIAPLLCMPKAFVAPVQSLLQSTERQVYVILSTVLASIIDIGVAWALIPGHGAVGACIGNGTAQIAAVGSMWAIAVHLFKVRLPWALTAKIASASALAALSAHLVAVRLPPLLGILAGGCTSLLVLLILIYALRVLEPEDRDRFLVLTKMLPGMLATPAIRILPLLVSPAHNYKPSHSEIDIQGYTDSL